MNWKWARWKNCNYTAASMSSSSGGSRRLKALDPRQYSARDARCGSAESAGSSVPGAPSLGSSASRFSCRPCSGSFPFTRFGPGLMQTTPSSSAVVCPFMLDQFYWAERMFWLGVAPEPLKKDHLLPDENDEMRVREGANMVARAINYALSPEVKAHATEIAERLSLEAHNVVVVNNAGYNSCNAPRGSKVYSSGKDQIKVSKGQNFFICSFPGHCQSAMKIAVVAA